MARNASECGCLECRSLKARLETLRRENDGHRSRYFWLVEKIRRAKPEKSVPSQPDYSLFPPLVVSSEPLACREARFVRETVALAEVESIGLRANLATLAERATKIINKTPRQLFLSRRDLGIEPRSRGSDLVALLLDEEMPGRVREAAGEEYSVRVPKLAAVGAE